MHKNKVLHTLGLVRPSRSLSMLLLAYFLISSHFTFAIGTGMLSTSTSSPEALTTPKHSAANHEALKGGLTDFLTLAVSMTNLKSAEALLTNSSLIKKIESDLGIFEDMMNVIKESYGFRLGRNSPTNACALEYRKEKQVLLREFKTLLTDCKDAMDNLDMLHLAKADQAESIIIHGCSERTKTIHLDVARLIGQIHEISYICRVKSVKNILKELIATKLFVYVNENSKLLLRELDFLLKNYGSILANTRKNETFLLVQNVVKNLKIEFEHFKQVMDSGVMNETISNFTISAMRLLNDNRTQKENVSRKLGLYAYDMAEVVKEIFERHLKVPDKYNDSVENWAKSPGLYKVVFLNNKLKEAVSKLSLSIPKYGAFRRAQLDLSNAELYRGVSPTFGKPCENSPHHLVGTCTAENHEICRHVAVNWGSDDDQELLSEEELILLGNLELKHCTCGFRTNCERHSDRKSTCFLIPNNDGQCRGGEKYPCVTDPLESGSYDESCTSGYCNLEENSCEVDPHGDTTGLKKIKKTVKTNLVRLAKFFKK